MKAKDACRILGVSNVTLADYVKKGYVQALKLPSGRYNYDEASIYAFLNRDIIRRNYIYARVSSSNQKKELETQVDLLVNYCFQNGIKVDGVFKDIASGISFEKRDNFFEMLDDVTAGKVDKVIITYKDRLSRVGFELFYHLFAKYGTEIIVVSEVGSSKLDAEEIFEEIVSLLHCYSMKLYSKRRVAKIKEVLKDDSLSD